MRISPSRSRSAALIAAALAVGGGLVAAPAASAAPTASAAAGIATFTDPDNAAGALSATLQLVNGPSVDPQGWNVAFFQFSPSVASGAGCQDGLVGVVCPFGASAPGGINVNLGGGNDELTLEVAESAASFTGTVSIKGGAGNDRISTIRAKAAIDGGDGDDMLLPDEIRPIVAAPGLTPGGEIRGGAGNDTVAYESTPTSVNVSLDGVANDGRIDGPNGASSERDNVFPDVENIVGPAKGSLLTGNALDNTITGGAGNDKIDGLDGDDTLNAGAGNDEINAVDGVGDDAVTCGDGDDLVFADYGDAVDKASCETVVWAPALSSKSLRYKSKKIRVGLKCPKEATSCMGTLILRTTGKKPATIAKARYDVAKGKKSTVTLKATSAGRKAMKKKAIKATALIELDGGPTPLGAAVKIRR
jgi:hypothetical protein